MVTYFLVLAVGCEECREPTEVIDIGFDEDKARSAAMRIALDQVSGSVRDNLRLTEGPPYMRDHPEGQSCIAHWGPIQVHKFETLAPDEVAASEDSRVAAPVSRVPSTSAEESYLGPNYP